MKSGKKIIALVCIIAIFSSLFVPFASAADYQSTANSLWEYFLASEAKFFEDVPLLGATHDLIGFAFTDTVCNLSEDHFHHTNSLAGCTTGSDKYGLYANATCRYCGEPFRCYSSDLKASYEQGVDSLPAGGVASDGALLYRPPVLRGRFLDYASNGCYQYLWGDWSAIDTSSVLLADGSFSVSSSDVPLEVFGQPSLRDESLEVEIYYLNSAPVSGAYSIVEHGYEYGSYMDSAGASGELYRVAWAGSSDIVHFDVGDDFLGSKWYHGRKRSDVVWLRYTIQAPLYKIVPDAVEGGLDYTTIYDNSTRVGNVKIDYGTKIDDNSVTNVTNNYIVNETNNTYTNPVTGTEKPIQNWSYDYGDRSYNLTFEGGDTTTVTYGDENITINENTVNESGDTTTNNYTIYYVVNTPTADPDPSPSPSPSPAPSDDPGGGSGTNPGGGSGSGSGSSNSLSRVFANYAAEITQAYGTDGHGGTDCIPSSGAADTVTAHSEGDVVWVQTDQTNNQGSTGDISYGNAVKIKHSNGYYTLYAHLATVEVANGAHVYKGQSLGMMGDSGNAYGAHLHFEVRDDTDTRINSDPYLNADLPGLEGGGSTGDSIWDKLGQLLGTGVAGLLDLLSAVLNKVLDGLIRLLEGLVARLTTVVETVLSVFDVIPTLFGGFLDLLVLLFPFLPPEIVTILTFGIIAVVAIWIIKALKGR